MTSLHRIRQRIKKHLTSTCTIQRRTTVRDEYNAQTNDYEIMAQNVPCRVITAGTTNASTTRDIGGVDSTLQTVRIAFAHGQPLPLDGRIIVGGAVYNIVQVNADYTDAIFTNVIAQRVIDA